MRIIFLNTWNCKRKEAIKDFVAKNSEDTDVFCFQEVYTEARKMFENLLTGWNAAYAHKRINENADFSQATYIKKDLKLRSRGALLDGVPRAGLGLYTEIEGKNGSVHICNFHGVTYAKDDKLDDPERLQQSRTLVDFFHLLQGRKIVGGDFNILPHAESMHIFPKSGYVDLIEKWNIQTTRNRLAWEMYPSHELHYSDYVFVSPDVRTRDFTVPQNEISDHLPMILDMED